MILQNRKIIYIFLKITFVLPWIFYKVFAKEKIAILIRTEIFGNQILDFQGVNSLALSTQYDVYICLHPEIKGKFLIKKQVDQIGTLPNIRFINHFFMILRLYVQDVENTFSRYLNLKPKKLSTNLREESKIYENVGATMYHQIIMPSFPVFTEFEKKSHKYFLKNNFKNIFSDKPIIAVHSRSGNYPKYKEPKKVSDEYRNTSFSEINQISQDFDTRNFTFVRIGYNEKFESDTASKIVDIREILDSVPEAQISVFTNISAYVGSSSGPVSFFINQKIPCLLISVFPVERNYYLDPTRLVIVPKLIYDVRNKRYLNIEEQFSKDILDIGLTYNDRLMKNINLAVHSIPTELSRNIYKNWQHAILKNNLDSEWLKSSVKASIELGIGLNRVQMPVIPIEYFNYLKSLTN